MLFKITNDVVKLKGIDGFSDRYVIEEACKFLYYYKIHKLVLVIRGNELTLELDKNYDAMAVYNQFREMQHSMVEEAAKNLPDFYDNIKYPYKVVTPLNLETEEDANLQYSIEEAIAFAEEFNIEQASFKHQNKLAKLCKGCDLCSVYDKLKTKDDLDQEGGLGI